MKPIQALERGSRVLAVLREMRAASLHDQRPALAVTTIEDRLAASAGPR